LRTHQRAMRQSFIKVSWFSDQVGSRPINETEHNSRKGLTLKIQSGIFKAVQNHALSYETKGREFEPLRARHLSLTAD
jgi:hypothetical protein